MPASALNQQVFSLPQLISDHTWVLEEKLRKLIPTPEQIGARQILLTGSGDSIIAATAVTQIFRELVSIPTLALPAAEASRYFLPTFDNAQPRTPLTFAVSNSGEVARVVEAAIRAQQVGGSVIALTANSDSRLAQHADYLLDTQVPEFPGASGLRTYVGSLLALSLFAIRLGEVRGRITMDQAQALRAELAHTSELVSEAAKNLAEPLRELASQWAQFPAIEFIGTGPARGSAQFGAAKVLEATGLIAHDVDVEEFFHLNYFVRANTSTPVIVFGSSNDAAFSRIAELQTQLQQLQRPYAIFGDSSGTPFTYRTGREFFRPIVDAAVGGLFAAELMAATGEQVGRGVVGPWASCAGGATTRNGEIIPLARNTQIAFGEDL